jgi:metal-dependent amidase/aminoacylase/carboxypeptidase family protein
MTIFPALYRVEGNNQHDILVSKGTLLVKACEESLPPLKKLKLAWSADSRDQSPSIKPEPDNMTQNRTMQNIPWTSNHAGSSQKFQKRAAGDGNFQDVIPKQHSSRSEAFCYFEWIMPMVNMFLFSQSSNYRTK